MSIHEEVIGLCIGEHLMNRDSCTDLGDTLSSHVYGSVYSPSRRTTTIEDMYTQRFDIISYLQESYQYESYLEIGCDVNQSFGKLRKKFQRSACVDPNKGGSIRMTSDVFFAQNTEHFDLIFIDGLHTAEQVAMQIFI
jgi:hypothetical protein